MWLSYLASCQQGAQTKEHPTASSHSIQHYKLISFNLQKQNKLESPQFLGDAVV